MARERIRGATSLHGRGRRGVAHRPHRDRGLLDGLAVEERFRNGAWAKARAKATVGPAPAIAWQPRSHREGGPDGAARSALLRGTRGPHDLTVAPDGTVVASLHGSDQVALIRGGRPRRVTLGGRPCDVKIAGGLVVVTNQGASRLDPMALDGTRRGRIPLRSEPHDVAVEPGARRVWVSLDGEDGSRW